MVVHAWSPITLEAIIWISNSEVAWILNIETLSQKKLNKQKKKESMKTIHASCLNMVFHSSDIILCFVIQIQKFDINCQTHNTYFVCISRKTLLLL